MADGVDKTLFKIISDVDYGSAYILSLSAVGIRGEVMMHALEQAGIIVGNGSACSSKHRYSRVIESCGYDEKVLDGVIRISFSAENTEEEAKTLVLTLNQTASKLKKIMG